jgi:ferrous iron transport protein A
MRDGSAVTGRIVGPAPRRRDLREHHGNDGRAGSPRRAGRGQRPADRPQSGGVHDHDGQPEQAGEIDVEPPFAERRKQPSRPLDDDDIAVRRRRRKTRAHEFLIDAAALQRRRPRRGEGRPEHLRTDRRERPRLTGSLPESSRIGAGGPVPATGHGLVDAHPSSGRGQFAGQRRRDPRFSHVGVGSGDEQSVGLHRSVTGTRYEKPAGHVAGFAPPSHRFYTAPQRSQLRIILRTFPAMLSSAMDAHPGCLDRIAVGRSARITAVNGGDATALRLLEMGLTPGASVRVVAHAPLGDPLELEVRGYRLSLRRSDAARVAVAAP